VRVTTTTTTTTTTIDGWASTFSIPRPVPCLVYQMQQPTNQGSVYQFDISRCMAQIREAVKHALMQCDMQACESKMLVARHNNKKYRRNNSRIKKNDEQKNPQTVRAAKSVSVKYYPKQSYTCLIQWRRAFGQTWTNFVWGPFSSPFFSSVYANG